MKYETYNILFVSTFTDELNNNKTWKISHLSRGDLFLGDHNMVVMYE